MLFEVAAVFLGMNDEIFLLTFGKELQEALVFGVILSDLEIHEVGSGEHVENFASACLHQIIVSAKYQRHCFF